jgi:hypothetical protein
VVKEQFKMESSKLKGERKSEEEDNREARGTERWRRDDRVVGKRLRLTFTRHGSTIVREESGDADCGHI